MPEGPWPTPAELVELRTAVRTALHDAVEGTDASRRAEAIEALNATAARAAFSPRLMLDEGGKAKPSTDCHGASRAEVVLAAIAADALSLVAGPRRARRRACHAPGCDYYFFQDRPRRAWCSNACGNRARQARHYERTRQAQASR